MVQAAQTSPYCIDCIRYEIRDGEAVYFWFDNWLEMGNFLDTTGELGINYLGVSKNATLAEAAGEDGWNISRCGRRRYPMLYDNIAEINRPDANVGPDQTLWRHDHDDFKPSFSASKTCNYLRIKKTITPWHNLVWFPQAIPQQSFMVCLAFLDRLSTGVRMRRWGIE